MKQLFSLLFFVLVSIPQLFAQQTELHTCGTADHPPHMLNWLRNFQQAPINYRDEMTEPVYIPIKFHLVGTTQGTGYYPNVDVFRLVCDLNRQFSPTGMQFYISGNFNYIANSNYYIHNFSAGENMMDTYNQNNVVNVYIVEDPAGNCGYFSWGGNAVAIAKSCADANETTLAHELGHFFFLPHTFRGWEGRWEGGVLVDPLPVSQRERVNGSNCLTTGDFFCDTPADYLSYRWACPYTGVFLDPNGTPIDPDESLYMSYAFDACTKRFSPQQINAMLNGLYNVRTDLLTSPQPTVTQVGNSFVYYPSVGNQNVNPNAVYFQWSPAPGATNYYVEVMQYTNLNGGTNFSGFVTGTELTLQLDPGTTYFWTVQPLSPGNTCGGRATGTFDTAASSSLYLSDLELDMPDCNGSLSGTVALEIAGGTAPYTIEWSGGLTGAVQNNLAPGQYWITVTDSDDATNVLVINVPQPTSINASIVQTDNFAATVSVSGGTIPYTIQWSNGETGSNAFGLNVGQNTVTITDANGCTLVQNTNSLAVQAIVNNISCAGEVNGSIDLQLFGGTPPYVYAWSNGASTGLLNNLHHGNYAVTVTDAAGAVLNLTYPIIEPNPLQATVTLNWATLNAQVTGGVPPYTFFFPTGVYDVPTANITGLTAGTYEVWIYDFNGCYTTATFTTQFTVSAQTPQTPAAEVTVYPTLVHKGQQVTVELLSQHYHHTQTTITVYSSEGKLVWQQKDTLAPNSSINIPTANLAAGMYYIHLQNQNKTEALKFVVM